MVLKNLLNNNLISKTEGENFAVTKINGTLPHSSFICFKFKFRTQKRNARNKLMLKSFYMASTFEVLLIKLNMKYP